MTGNDLSARFKRYPTYKDSGIEWLGEIPAHWAMKRTKFAARLRSGHTPSRQEAEYWVNCTIPWFGLADVWQIRDGRMEYVTHTAEKISELGLANSAARLLPKGTVILSRTASVGFSAIMGVDMATTQDFVNWVCGPNLKPEYLLYVFRSMQEEFRRLTMGSTHQTIYMPDVERFSTPLPPGPEQDRIVAFVRDHARRIDDLIKKKERVIELLQEKRSALIAHAVTKGLDPSVPMKDSGVEWVGRMPAHWQILPLKRRARKIQTGTTPPTSETKYYEDGTTAWYGPGSFADPLPLGTPSKFISASAVHDGVARMFEQGSALVVTIGATIGKVAYMEDPGSCNQQITGVTFDRIHVHPKYGAYQLKRLEPVLRGIAPNTTLPILDQAEVGYLPFAVPTESEQRAITDFLDRETEKIDVFLVKVKEAIDRLNEFRTAVIFAAVTGKIDVRDETV